MGPAYDEEKDHDCKESRQSRNRDAIGALHLSLFREGFFKRGSQIDDCGWVPALR